MNEKPDTKSFADWVREVEADATEEELAELEAARARLRDDDEGLLVP